MTEEDVCQLSVGLTNGLEPGEIPAGKVLICTNSGGGRWWLSHQVLYEEDYIKNRAGYVYAALDPQGVVFMRFESASRSGRIDLTQNTVGDDGAVTWTARYTQINKKRKSFYEAFFRDLPEEVSTRRCPPRRDRGDRAERK